MIIPQIAGNLTKSNNLHLPEYCPTCHGKTIIKNDSDVEYLYCTNEFCPAKLVKKLSLFVSRNAMNIDGLGDRIIEDFYNYGYIKRYSDIYYLYKKREEIISLEGIGNKSVDN